MKIEIIIGLSIFAVLILNLIQFLIRQRSEKVRQQKVKALSEFKIRREEVERKARRQL
ncbi:hypothetical protein [Escherichia coli]|uniref:hypothetical protein n=1 Tax=Escherichia coli TaxID=562 RepID=UPI001553943D|nr:hypothetical protein [Escherichia coli]